MKEKEKKELHFVVNNLIKIRTDKGFRQGEFANIVEIDPSIWNKIESGKLKLSLENLSNIAEKLNMRTVDFFTYPKKFFELERSSEEVKAVLTVELRQEVKDQILKIVFGNENVKLLNK